MHTLHWEIVRVFYDSLLRDLTTWNSPKVHLFVTPMLLFPVNLELLVCLSRESVMLVTSGKGLPPSRGIYYV